MSYLRRRNYVMVRLPLRRDLWRSLVQGYRDESAALDALSSAFAVAVLNASTQHIATRVPPGTVTYQSTGLPRKLPTDGIEVTEGDPPPPSHDEVDPWGRSWD